MTKSKDNDKESRSKITKHEGTILQRRQRQRQKLNEKSNLIDLMKECYDELTSGEIVSLKILSRTRKFVHQHDFSRSFFEHGYWSILSLDRKYRHSFLHTSYKPLHLNHILVTPHIIKNLISVCKFTRDNDVSIGKKMHKAFPLPVIEFPLPEEKRCHCCEDCTATKVKKKLSVKVK
nr:ribonuclease H-like domain-containing protein [Tanacetum cinerariifolium]